MKEPDLNPPGKIPYRWFWVLGGAILLIAVLSAIQGIGFLSVSSVFGGVMVVILGFIERRRGAPPI
ncbi:hypothetical protein ACFDTO_07410 [Microbacteriaceae bacterium 4G12]